MHEPHTTPAAPGRRGGPPSRSRIEPDLDAHVEAWEDVRFGSGPAAGVARSGGPLGGAGLTRTHWLVIAAVIALAVVLLVLRQPLSDWLWPQTRAQQLRSDAALALAQGRLTSADGRGARELYEAALALDPDRADARSGLTRVGQAALVQARNALATHRYGDAHRTLALARELGVPTSQVDAVAVPLRQREAAEAGIDRLLLQAAAARTSGHLDGDDRSALRLYQRVLTLQPSHTQALEGREDTLADLLQQAQQALARGELHAAATVVHRVRDADPGHAGLPGALTDLAQASEQRRRRADLDLRRARLARARDGYRAVLAVDPDDVGAQRGLADVATAYAHASEQLAGDFKFDQAQAALLQARDASPDVPALAQARQHLARARQSQARYGIRLPAAERERRLRQWLQQAAAAEARGDLLSPPGDSAFDKLRAARAIAPQNARVRRASARLLPAARACFESELRGNRLIRARECLDARRAIEGDGAALGEARRRLAQRWIAVGNERLGAGEMQAAKSALAAARELDPGTAGLDEFAQRLRAASPSD